MALFRKLSKLYAELESTSSNLAMRDIIVKSFRTLKPEEVKIGSYFTVGVIGPKYRKVDLGIASKMVERAIAKATRIKLEKVKAMHKKLGDLGDVAQKLCKGTTRLTIKKVYDQLWQIKNASGAGSQEKKIQLLSQLLKSSTKLDAKYITRIALGKLRLGAGDKTLLDAFSILYNKDKKDIEHLYNMNKDIGAIGEALVKGKQMKEKKGKGGIILGRPIQAMLAQRTKRFKEILSRMVGKIAAEEKYDGERIQIHINNKKVEAFSRRLTNITNNYPDIIKNIKIKAKSAILDGEVVAYRNNKILSFQTLMQRRRKHNIDQYAKDVPAAVFLFDILYLNGKSLLHLPYPQRRKLLEKTVIQNKKVHFARRKLSDKESVLRAFFNKCIKAGLEGIIAKSTAKDSIYKPGKRGWYWIKWKKEYSKDMQDTFDLVVIGAFRGKGQRKNTFGALLCAIYNSKERTFESFTKVGSGFKEQDFQDLTKALSKYAVSKKPKSVKITKAMEPDIYYKPSLVIEVLGAEITKSPNHAAKLALRFPRFLRIRKDKNAKQATTKKEII